MDNPLSTAEIKEQIAENIRCAGIEYKRLNNPDWRDKPFHDGIIMDLDETDEVNYLAESVFRLLRGYQKEWAPR